MNKTLATAATAALLAAAAYAPAHATVTFGSAKVIANASADTNYGQESYSQAYGTRTRTASSYQSLLTAVAGAQATSYDDGGAPIANATAKETSSISLSSDASGGDLYLSGQTTATSSSGDTAEAYNEGQSAQYVFSVDRFSNLFLTSFISDMYTGSGSQIHLYVGAADQSTSLFNADVTSGGSYNYLVGPGTYLISLYSQEGDYTSTSSPGGMGFHSELLYFNLYDAHIVPGAPEPGTWALMMTGVGLAGLALRRRRRADALAAAA